VLPYALFNAAVGLAPAFARFGPYYLRGEPVPTHALALHLSVTAFFITLFVVGAARFKTRVDFLSPLVLVGERPESRGTLWSVPIAFSTPLVTYATLRIGFSLAGVEGIRELWAAVCLKVGVCLALALITAYWAVHSVLAEMEEKGLDRHPYVLMHRVLRETGNLDPAAPIGEPQ